MIQNPLSKLKEKTFNKKSTEGNLLDIWHYLMINYGYIPFEEFKKMDAYLVNELVERLNKMNEEINKGNKSPKGKKKW